MIIISTSTTTGGEPEPEGRETDAAVHTSDEPGPEPMSARNPIADVKLLSLTLSDGGVVPMPRDGVLLIVGPNNSGKSAALRDIYERLANDRRGIVVTDVAFEKIGTTEQLLDRLRDAGRRVDTLSGPKILVGGGQYEPSNVDTWWTGYPNYLPTLASTLVLHATTETRLRESHPVPALNLYTDSPTLPIHFIFAHPKVETALDTFSRKAFGSGVTLDRFAGGSHWALRLGDRPGQDRPFPSEAFLQAMQRLPLVHEQGDGVKSLIGLMLLWYAGGHSVALVDEPEAFLHPPQAALLGRHLARQAQSSKRQLILSTHSADIVRGVMLGGGEVVVARLTREGNINTAALVSQSVVKSLWDDPQLRYSNVFEGLFSDAVMVCEAESDCKYFAAVLDADWEAEDEAGAQDQSQRRPDLLFTGSGGKDRLHVAASAMTAASVPVRAIADFDLLRDEAAVQRLVESLGATYTASMGTRWHIMSAALAQESQVPNVLAVRDRVMEVFGELPDGAFTTKEKDRVAKVLKTNSAWGHAKDVGVEAVPKGEARAAAEALLTELESVGLFVVPVGEVEGFVPDVGGHGAAWVAGVLEAGKHRAPHSEVARKFLGRLLLTLESPDGEVGTGEPEGLASLT